MIVSRRSILLAPFGSDWVAADGSEFPYSSWRVSEGVLQAIGGLPTFQDIKTRRLYEDFDFRFEFKMLKAGNSGVKYQIEKSDRWQPKGLEGFHIRARGAEMQLADDEANEDAQKGGVKQCGALYNFIAPAHRAKLRVGDFTPARLLQRGLHVEHWIAGEKLVDYELKSSKPSPIALQNHACDVWFRKLEIVAL